MTTTSRHASLYDDIRFAFSRLHIVGIKSQVDLLIVNNLCRPPTQIKAKINEQRWYEARRYEARRYEAAMYNREALLMLNCVFMRRQVIAFQDQRSAGGYDVMSSHAQPLPV